MKTVHRALLLAAIILVAWVVIPMDRFPDLLAWMETRGLQGAFVVGAIYVIATVAMIPGSLLTLGIGAVYGPGFGFAIVSPASVVGATLAFLLGRGIFSKSLEKRMEGNHRFHALRLAIEEEGLKVLFLVRLSPVFPYTLANYVFGLTRLKTSTYIIGSFLGMLPGTLMYVYLGAIAGDVATIARGGIEEGAFQVQVMKWVGLAATILLMVVVTRRAKRALSVSISDEIQSDR